MYAVKEVSVSSESLRSGGIVWHPDLVTARRVAATLAPMSLAHRMLIVRPGQDKGRVELVEDVELEPLAVRVCIAHLLALRSRDPQRMHAELAGERWTGATFARDAVPLAMARLGLSFPPA